MAYPEVPNLSDAEVAQRLSGLEVSLGVHVDSPEERIVRLKIEKGTHFVKLRKTLDASLYAGPYKDMEGKDTGLREAILRSESRVGHFVYDPRTWQFISNFDALQMVDNPVTEEQDIVRDLFMPPVLTTPTPNYYVNLLRESGGLYESTMLVRAQHIADIASNAGEQFVTQTTSFLEDFETRTVPTVISKFH